MRLWNDINKFISFIRPAFMTCTSQGSAMLRMIFGNSPWLGCQVYYHASIRVIVYYDDVEVEDESFCSFTSGVRSKFPSRGGVFRSMNSMVVGSLSPAWRSAAGQLAEIRRGNSTTLPSRASSSRTGAPPISKMTRPVGTLDRKP
jgi:hypothetical protein